MAQILQASSLVELSDIMDWWCPLMISILTPIFAAFPPFTNATTSLGCTTFRRTITNKINTASKKYRNISCERIYPLKPWRHSTTRKIDRIIIRKLAAYNITRCLRHGLLWLRARDVGILCMAMLKCIATTMKQPKNRSWMNRPPMMICEPVARDVLVPDAWIPPPRESSSVQDRV